MQQQPFPQQPQQLFPQQPQQPHLRPCPQQTHKCTTCGHVHQCQNCKDRSLLQHAIEPPKVEYFEPIIQNTAKVIDYLTPFFENLDC